MSGMGQRDRDALQIKTRRCVDVHPAQQFTTRGRYTMSKQRAAALARCPRVMAEVCD